MALLMVLLTSASAALGGGCGSKVSGSSSGDGGSGGGGDGGAGAANECFDYNDFRADFPLVSFSKEVLPLFRRSCGLSASCHQSLSAPLPAQHFLGPNISDPDPDMPTIQKILDGVVGKSSVQEKTMQVIAPGNAKQSYLMYKVDGVTCNLLTCLDQLPDKCGKRMPQDAKTPLAAEERDLIRRWIAQGAKNN
jgi:hypothetical protein